MSTQPVSRQQVNLYISNKDSKKEELRKDQYSNIDGIDGTKGEFISISAMEVAFAKGDLDSALKNNPSDVKKIESLKNITINKIDTLINQVDTWDKKLEMYLKMNHNPKMKYTMYKIYTDNPKAKIKETYVMILNDSLYTKELTVYPLDCGYSSNGTDTYDYLKVAFQSKEDFFKTIKAGYKVNEVLVGDIGVDNNNDGKLDLDANGKKILDGKSDVYYNPVKIIHNTLKDEDGKKVVDKETQVKEVSSR